MYHIDKKRLSEISNFLNAHEREIKDELLQLMNDESIDEVEIWIQNIQNSDINFFLLRLLCLFKQ